MGGKDGCLCRRINVKEHLEVKMRMLPGPQRANSYRGGAHVVDEEADSVVTSGQSKGMS
jgi:hypothetical protein